jgi:hypothetical protein
MSKELFNKKMLFSFAKGVTITLTAYDYELTHYYYELHNSNGKKIGNGKIPINEIIFDNN